jgi:hypothetical protein
MVSRIVVFPVAASGTADRSLYHRAETVSPTANSSAGHGYSRRGGVFDDASNIPGPASVAGQGSSMTVADTR